MFITTEVIIDAELGAERAFSLCQEYQVIARFGKPPCRFERPLYGLARSRDYCAAMAARQLWAVLSITSSPASCAYASNIV